MFILFFIPTLVLSGGVVKCEGGEGGRGGSFQRCCWLRWGGGGGSWEGKVGERLMGIGHEFFGKVLVGNSLSIIGPMHFYP